MSFNVKYRMSRGFAPFCLCLIGGFPLSVGVTQAQDVPAAPKAFPSAPPSNVEPGSKTADTRPQPVALPSRDPFPEPTLIGVEHTESRPRQTVQRDDFFAPVAREPVSSNTRSQATFKTNLPKIDPNSDSTEDPFFTDPPNPQGNQPADSVFGTEGSTHSPTPQPIPSPQELPTLDPTGLPIPEPSQPPPLSHPSQELEFQRTSNSQDVYSPPAEPPSEFSSQDHESVFGSFGHGSTPAQPRPASAPSGISSNQQPATIEIHEVQPGENYWTISRKYFGAARYFAALAEFNKARIPRPDRMKPGMFVMVPNVEFLETRYPQLSWVNQGRNKPDEPQGFFIDPTGQPAFRIGKGDTLTDIAQSHLGRMTRWQEIYQLNQQTLGPRGTLRIGMVLRLPADACQVSLAPPISEIR